MPDDPRLPRLPGIAPERLTPTQLQSAISRARGALNEVRGDRSVMEWYGSASRRDRAWTRQLGALERQATAKRVSARQRQGYRYPAGVELRANRPLTPLENVQQATLVPLAAHLSRGHGSSLRNPSRLARAFLYEIPRVYVEEKGAPLKKDADFLLDSAVGLVKAPFAIARGQGDDLVDAMLDDYEDRYKEALEGDWEGFREQVKRSGSLSYAADAAIVAPLPLKVGGGLAKAGALGTRAERFITAPRPGRRVSPGDVRRQRDETEKLMPNPLRVATQRRRDAKREGAHVKREVKAHQLAALAKERGDVPEGGRRLVQPAERVNITERGEAAIASVGGHVVRGRYSEVRAVVIPEVAAARVEPSLVSQGWTRQATRGDTVTYFPPREVVSRHRTRERFEQRRSPARMKGRAVNELRGMTNDARRQFAQATKGLSKPEREAVFYALTQGARRVEHLDRTEAAILAQRTRPDGSVVNPGRFEADELDKIAYLRQHADEAFTPTMAAAVEALRPLIREGERGNPMLPIAQAINARYGPLGELLGLERREVTVENFDARATAKAIERHDRKRGLAPTKRTASGETAPVGRDVVLLPDANGRLEVRRGNDAPGSGVSLARFVRERSPSARTNVRRLVVPVRSQPNTEGMARLTRLMAERGFNARRADDGAVIFERGSERVSRNLRDRAASKRGEPTADFLRRVVEAARGEGRAAPEFAPSQARWAPRFSNYTAGGTAVPEPPPRRTYALQRRGVQRTDLGIVYEGVQRNLKMRVSANLVADMYDRHSHPKYRNMTLAQLQAAARREGWDLRQVAFWFPKRYREALEDYGRQAEDMRARGEQPEAVLEDLEAPPPELREAVKAATLPGNVDIATVARRAPEFLKVRGTIIPRTIHNEIFSATRPDSALERVFERLKTMQSRAVLGALNINWVQADFLGNAALSMLGAGVGPITVIRSMRFFRSLPEEVRAKLEAELDVGNARFQTHVPHMGSTVNNKVVNTWRAWRATPLGQTARPVRKTIDAFLAVEKVIANDPWRRAVAYKMLRNEAFLRIDRNAGNLNAAVDKLVNLWSSPIEDQMRALAGGKDWKTIEQVGRLTDEVLGDFATMTAIERRTVGRFLFFYPWLRFSVRATFYSLPMNHPVRVAVAAQVGRLTEDEQRELLGVRDDEAGLMRGLMAGRFFFRDENGQVREMNIRTLNPIGNPVTESEGSQDILLAMPPWAQWVLGQIEKRDLFRGRPWNVGGEATRPTLQPKVNVGHRARILTRQALELPPITREMVRHFLPGEQSDESLPLWEIPMVYRTPERQAQADAKRDRDLKESLAQQLLRSGFRAFTSKPSDIEAQIGRRRQRAGVREPVSIAKPSSSGSATSSRDPDVENMWNLYDQGDGSQQLQDPEVEEMWRLYDGG